MVPGIIGIGYSFTDWSAYSSELHFVGLQNFIDVFSGDQDYLQYILNTLLFTVVTTVAKTGLGLLFASDFTKYFTIFHEIFFTNDLWLFDPATDYMIRMLPEGFFYDMVMRIGAIFTGLLLLLAAVFLIWRHAVRKMDKKNL